MIGTASRTMVDTNAMLGLPGPMILAEQRSLSKRELLDIAALADAQHVRLYDAAEMKCRLGAANVP